MALEKVGSPLPTAASSVGSTTLAAVVLIAGGRLGMQDKALAAVFGLTAPDFSSAFSPHRRDRNRLMKQELPDPLAREIAKVLGEHTGLSVGGPDTVRHAMADVADAMARYLRVVGVVVLILTGGRQL